MLILALDTSSRRGACAICRDGAPLAERAWSREKSHSEIATAALEALAQEAGGREAGFCLAKLDALAVGIGPGSFTGIRVAVNAAKALAYALDKPIYCFDTCAILAEGAERSDLPLLTLVEAHKNLVYASTFGPSPKGADGMARPRWSDAQAIRLEELEALLACAPAGLAAETLPKASSGAASQWLCVGDGFAAREADLFPALRPRLLRSANSPDQALPSALARLAERARASGEPTPFDWKSAQPLYVRGSEAEERLREG
jgi:tRNA threonylcarbamoyladenosine biosynthesis protein TsaB